MSDNERIAEAMRRVLNKEYENMLRDATGFTTYSNVNSGANLTAADLEKTLAELTRDLPPPPRSPFAMNLFPLGGLDIIDAPPPMPKIQVRDIKLNDGTSILSPEFRAETNAWLLERFGYRDDIFKDRAYLFGKMAIMRADMRRQIVNWWA